MILDAVRDLYVARWGPPSRNARFHVEDYAVEVLKWNATVNPEGVDLYATVGGSAQPTAGAHRNHRLEFFIGLLPGKDEVASPLAALALYSAREHTVLNHGDTVPSDGPLWPETEFRRFLLLRPLSDFLPPLQFPDGLHVDFLQAIPIFDSEFSYKAERGAEALLRQWEQSKVEFWNPDRRPRQF